MKTKLLLVPALAVVGVTALFALASGPSAEPKSDETCGPCCLMAASAQTAAVSATPVATAALDEKATAYLAAYEKLRAALAADDLAAAKTAAAAVEGAEAVASAKSIGDARKAFVLVSAKALALAKGQPGYFHAHCPMYPGGGDWVQTSKQISNPYWGKTMLRCGEIKE